MVCIPFAFQPITGSHTGLAIKQQYDSIVDEFQIKNKGSPSFDPYTGMKNKKKNL